MVFGNLTEDDILLRAELDALTAQHPRRLRVHYVLNTPPAGKGGWAGGVGFVTADVIREHLPAPGPGVMVLRCGPPAMNKAMQAHLEALGYAEDALFEF